MFKSLLLLLVNSKVFGQLLPFTPGDNCDACGACPIRTGGIEGGCTRDAEINGSNNLGYIICSGDTVSISGNPASTSSFTKF